MGHSGGHFKIVDVQPITFGEKQTSMEIELFSKFAGFFAIFNDAIYSSQRITNVSFYS